MSEPLHGTAIKFRPLRREDFPTVARWLAAPHVARWWSESPELDYIERKYGPRVDGTSPTEMFVIERDGDAVGLIQRYRLRDYPEWERAVGVHSAAGIDYLIGRVASTGVGVGSAAIARFAEETLATYRDVDAVCAVPQQANVASWRALEKAGFRRDRAVEKIESDDPADDGPAFIYVLTRVR